jgi:hypothetical protein
MPQRAKRTSCLRRSSWDVRPPPPSRQGQRQLAMARGRAAPGTMEKGLQRALFTPTTPPDPGTTPVSCSASNNCAAPCQRAPYVGAPSPLPIPIGFTPQKLFDGPRWWMRTSGTDSRFWPPTVYTSLRQPTRHILPPNDPTRTYRRSSCH